MAKNVARILADKREALRAHALNVLEGQDELSLQCQATAATSSISSGLVPNRFHFDKLLDPLGARRRIRIEPRSIVETRVWRNVVTPKLERVIGRIAVLHCIEHKGPSQGWSWY